MSGWFTEQEGYEMAAEERDERMRILYECDDSEPEEPGDYDDVD